MSQPEPLVCFALETGAADYQTFPRGSDNAADMTLTGAAREPGAAVEARLVDQVTGEVIEPFDWQAIGRPDKTGRWSGTLRGIPVGGEYRLQLRLVDEICKSLAACPDVEHLLVGDLWMAAGQSNMMGRGRLGPDREQGIPQVHVFDCDYRWRQAEEPIAGNKQTRFCVGYDDTHVFVAAIAEADNPAAFPQIDRGRDGEVWEDDSIELFFDGNHDHSTYIHLAANLRGDRYDGSGGPAKGKFGDKEWDADWQTAARTHDDFFVMEFAVPFSAMGVESAEVGTQFGLNVGRTRSAAATGNKSEFTGWAIVYADFHQVTHFGDVSFRAGGDQP